VARPRSSAMGVEAVQSVPPSDHHPTGASPAVMETASLSLAGCDCRPMGTSPIETKIAPRVFAYRISKRPRAWTGFVSRDARASGLKRATPCHVYSTSNRTARAEPRVLSESDDGLLRVECCDDRSVELVRLADVPGPDPFSESQLLGLELATELRALALRVPDRRDAGRQCAG
jgi:hypothetical protein